MRRSAIPALTALLSSGIFSIACSSGEQGSGAGEWVAAYDTIGDTIVVRTLSGSLWRDTADLVPEVSIGMFDGPEEYIFGDVVSLAHGSDGTIYVMDRQVPALRVYNLDGTYRTTFGREGEGPGEYKRPDGGLNVLSDGRIVLRDPSNARIQVYSPGGEALDTWRIRGNFNTSRRMVVDRQDRSHALILLDPEASVTDWKTGLMQINPDGTMGDTLVIPDTPWEEPTIEATHETEDGGTNMSVNSVPFAPTENAVLSPGGYFIHGISTEYALTLLRKNGPTLRIEKDFTPVAVAAGERREEEVGAVRNMRYTDPNWRWNGPPIPDVKPPFSRFYAGEDGTIWVAIHQPAKRVEDTFYDSTDPDAIPNEWREPLVFDVFAEDGSYLGAVRAPDGLSTYPQPVFTREWVLGVVRDEFDVQTVVRFRVDRSTRDPTRTS
ncbi:MAG: 6-bladed beta-propeller [Longimicrobiales bacterium]|nr:6-bladed beta-propeller [Longimicrobiales bacterium]